MSRKNRKHNRTRPPERNHESVVEDWKKNAEDHLDANFDFLHSLKWKEYGFDPDKLSAELHNEAFQIVDCLRCANCCCTTTTLLDQEDVDRISAYLKMTADEFIQKYCQPAPKESGDGYVIHQIPCPLLGDDNRCSVYDVRPKECREFPHTDKPEVVFRTHSIANKTTICPAAFWIVERMRDRAREHRYDNEDSL